MLKLTIIEFDLMENSVFQAENILDEKYFQDHEGKTAHFYCAKYISNLNLKSYLAWNDEVYPKYKIHEVAIERRC